MADGSDGPAPEAFDALVTGYWDRARFVAAAMCGVRPDWVADAQDAATFQLLRATRRYDPRRGPYESFAYSVVVRRVRKFLARRFRQSCGGRAHPGHPVPLGAALRQARGRPGRDCDGDWNLPDGRFRLRRGRTHGGGEEELPDHRTPPHPPIPEDYLGGLSLDQRQLLSLIYQEGLANADVARLTGRHRQSVGDRLERALARVRANVSRLQLGGAGAIPEGDTPQGSDAVPNRLPQSKPPKPARPRGADRPPPSARGYDRAWQRRRLAFLGANPLCEVCRETGRRTLAEEVHHRTPLSQGGTHAEHNLAALCKSCHSRTTARESSGFGRGDGG